MHYASPKHERLYRNVAQGKGYQSSTLAALYLLTAKRKLWKNWYRGAVSNAGIDWSIDIPRPDPGWDGYYLEQAARSLARRNHPQVTLYDLTDCASYPTELILLVLGALLLARGERKPKYIQERGKRTHVST